MYESMQIETSLTSRNTHHKASESQNESNNVKRQLFKEKVTKLSHKIV